MTDAEFYILVGIFVLIIILILLLVANRKRNNIVTLKTNDPAEFENFMREHNFPEEMIQNMKEQDIKVSSTQTIRKVKYVNGEKVSDTTETIQHTTPTLTYCPNCGAKWENNINDTCQYCNTKITKKKKTSKSFFYFSINCLTT